MVSRTHDRQKTVENTIDQEQYTEDLLKQQGMGDCNPLKINVTINENLSKQMKTMNWQTQRHIEV